MIIMVEGPDGAGKSTLCSALGDRLNCPVYKPVGSPLKTGMSTVESQGHDRGAISLLTQVAEHADVVMDRSFPSEIVYSTLFQRDFDIGQSWLLDEAVARVPHLGVLVSFPDRSDGWAIASGRGIPDLTEFEWRLAWKGYGDYAAQSRMSWLILDGDDSTEYLVERVLAELVRRREQLSSRDRTFMEMARAAARRSTCLSRRQGALLVSARGHVIAVGYNGPPTGFPHPKSCQRLRDAYCSTENLDSCDDVHAEENALIHAGMNGANPSGGTLYTVMSPCLRCARMLINAGVVEIVYERVYDERAMRMLDVGGIELTEVKA